MALHPREVNESAGDWEIIQRTPADGNKQGLDKITDGTATRMVNAKERMTEKASTASRAACSSGR
jgi:hypothetical protein